MEHAVNGVHAPIARPPIARPPLAMPEDCARPSLVNALRELAAPVEWAAAMRLLPSLIGAPKGDGRPVATLPGYMTGDASMAPLNRFLRSLGYRVYAGGLGFNRGKVDMDVAAFGDRLADIRKRNNGAQVTLIGWSLGGIIAREAARLFEADVREVITLGTPIIGGPKYTSIGSIYARLEGLDLDAFELEVHERNSIGFRQPVASIFTKSDGVVGWRASVDAYNPQARNICVQSTHLGLGLNPSVWRIIADLLANEDISVQHDEV
ncbi:MAG: alpha/beta fold hydrolase [Alphaproteobacteria bacterium]|nr:alpha/beta fold hydrolase [Alphaproteobacteria bacterium]